MAPWQIHHVGRDTREILIPTLRTIGVGNCSKVCLDQELYILKGTIYIRYVRWYVLLHIQSVFSGETSFPQVIL